MPDLQDLRTQAERFARLTLTPSWLRIRDGNCSMESEFIFEFGTVLWIRILDFELKFLGISIPVGSISREFICKYFYLRLRPLILWEWKDVKVANSNSSEFA